MYQKSCDNALLRARGASGEAGPTGASCYRSSLRDIQCRYNHVHWSQWYIPNQTRRRIEEEMPSTGLNGVAQRPRRPGDKNECRTPIQETGSATHESSPLPPKTMNLHELGKPHSSELHHAVPRPRRAICGQMTLQTPTRVHAVCALSVACLRGITNSVHTNAT